MKERQPDPTPEEIAERCAEIQSEWTPEQRLRRLRCDLRPVVQLCDGNVADVTADAYAAHQRVGA